MTKSVNCSIERRAEISTHLQIYIHLYISIYIYIGTSVDSSSQWFPACFCGEGKGGDCRGMGPGPSCYKNCQTKFDSSVVNRHHRYIPRNRFCILGYDFPPFPPATVFAATACISVWWCILNTNSHAKSCRKFYWINGTAERDKKITVIGWFENF